MSKRIMMAAGVFGLLAGVVGIVIGLFMAIVMAGFIDSPQRRDPFLVWSCVVVAVSLAILVGSILVIRRARRRDEQHE